MVEEKWGNKWTRFVDDNSRLITRIFEALEARDPIIEINQKCGELYKAGRENEVERLIKESGFDEIDRKTAKKLNPLLRKAARKMNRLGINWRDVLR